MFKYLGIYSVFNDMLSNVGDNSNSWCSLSSYNVPGIFWALYMSYSIQPYGHSYEIGTFIIYILNIRN